MTAPVCEGELLAGKYRVERVLGQGGMGVVVAARHVELRELVAVKFLLPDAVQMPEAIGRFLREARAAVRIKSEHVARVIDVGQLETGAPYMVMEYLEGSDLSQVLHARGPLPVEDAIDYVAQACEAMAEAHALGIVHRDLKPSNLMLVRGSDGSECVKLLDFGISKVTLPDAETAMSMTRTSALLGSPLYMSPEQLLSARDVDARADIWALGTILYELLTGEPPFVADTLPALGALIATTEPRPMRDLRPDIPPGLDAIAARCLAKRRENRFADVAQLAQAFTPFAPVRSRVSIERSSRILHGISKPLAPLPDAAPGPLAAREPGTASGLTGQPTASAWAGTSPSGSGRRKTMAAAIAATVVVAGGIALLTLLAPRRGPSAPAATASILAPSTSPSSSLTASAPPLRPPAAQALESPAPAPPALPPIAPTAPTTPEATTLVDDRLPPARRPNPNPKAATPSSAPPHSPPRPASQKSAYDDM